MTDPKPTASASSRTAKAYSCIRCFERKVKCDKDSPCSNCAKAGIECVFRIPPAPRRRKKRTQEEILKARLTQYEDILRSKGVDVQKDGIRVENIPVTTPGSLDRTISSSSPDSHEPSSPSTGVLMTTKNFVTPRLIVDHGRTHFVENNLWTAMEEGFRRPSDAMPESSDEDDDDTIADDNIGFVIGATPSSVGISDLHPLPEQVFTIWQIFLENVNPLSKIIHAPSVQPAIIEASSHLDKLPKNFEALLFSIYSSAILSLEAEECQLMLGESKKTLLSRYRSGTKKALARAKFLGTSDMMVLQSFVLHLLSMRDVYDSKTLWTLTGVGNRLAEGMGLHRDGTTLGLGPFETQMRRRLWWQLIFLDFRTAELTGSGHSGAMNLRDIPLPLNLDDADIWPGMKEEPVQKERATEMVFALSRYELGHFWKQKLMKRNPSGDFSTLWDNFRMLASIEDKEKGIEELEHHLEHKYVRYCDPSVPVEFMAILVTRAATNGMRLMTHHPRRYSKDDDMPGSERKLCWSLATKSLELDSLLHSSKPMKRFIWHTDHYFGWQALILALTELRKDPLGEHNDHGWQLVNACYEHHPSFLIKQPIHFAVGSLCLRAWKAREETWSQRSFPIPLIVPDYIVQLRKDRDENNMVLTPKPVSLSQDYFSQQQSQASPEVSIVTADSSTNDSEMDAQTNLLKVTRDLSLQQPIDRQTTTQQIQSFAQIPYPSQNIRMGQQPFLWWDLENQNAWNQVAEFNMDQTADAVQDAMDWSQWDVLLNTYRPTG